MSPGLALIVLLVIALLMGLALGVALAILLGLSREPEAIRAACDRCSMRHPISGVCCGVYRRGARP